MKSLAELQAIKKRMKDKVVLRDGMEGARVVVVDEALDATTLEQVLGDDLFDVLDGDSAIEGAIGVDDDDRAELAEAEAAGADQLDLVLQAVRLDRCLEGILDLLAARRGAPGAAADKDL